MRFSVIIPTINEEENIETQIQYIKALNGDVEIIVVDGGSSDNTVRLALRNRVRVLYSKPGRGTQLRVGASEASNEILLFLHADSRLPVDAFQKIRQFFSDSSCLMATFRISFSPTYLLLRVVSLFTKFDTLITRFGDQCIVTRRWFYDHIGGFPEWRLLEDVYLLEKAREYTTIRSMPSMVVSSSRRFKRNGVFRQLVWNAWIILLYLFGWSPDKLAEMYRREL